MAAPIGSPDKRPIEPRIPRVSDQETVVADIINGIYNANQRLHHELSEEQRIAVQNAELWMDKWINISQPNRDLIKTEFVALIGIEFYSQIGEWFSDYLEVYSSDITMLKFKKEILLNKLSHFYAYFNNCRNLIDENLESIVKQFGISPKRLSGTYTIQFLDPHSETHNGCKAPLLIKFGFKKSTSTQSIVYKPRNVAIEKSVMAAFQTINHALEHKFQKIPLLSPCLIVDKEKIPGLGEEDSFWEYIEVGEQDTKLRTQSKASILREAFLINILISMGIHDIAFNPNNILKSPNSKHPKFHFPIDLEVYTKTHQYTNLSNSEIIEYLGDEALAFCNLTLRNCCNEIIRQTTRIVILDTTSIGKYCHRPRQWEHLFQLFQNHTTICQNFVFIVDNETLRSLLYRDLYRGDYSFFSEKNYLLYWGTPLTGTCIAQAKL